MPTSALTPAPASVAIQAHFTTNFQTNDSTNIQDRNEADIRAYFKPGNCSHHQLPSPHQLLLQSRRLFQERCPGLTRQLQLLPHHKCPKPTSNPTTMQSNIGANTSSTEPSQHTTCVSPTFPLRIQLRRALGRKGAFWHLRAVK